MKSVKPFATLLLGTSVLFLVPLGWRPLWDSDEGRYAEIAREILQFRDWVSPHLNGVLYFEKPPLMYWLTAMSLSVFGQNAFAARLWCAVFALLTIALLYVIGLRWRNKRTGIIAGVVAATSLGFFIFSQFLVLDMALTFWTTLVLGAGAGLLVETSVQTLNRAALFFAVGLTGGFLTKGPVAFVLPFTAIAAAGIFTGRLKNLSRAAWGMPVAIFVLLASPWFVLVGLRHPFFLHFFFIHEHIARFLTNIHHREAPFYFFVPVVFGGFLPWSAFLPVVVKHWFSNKLVALRQDPSAALWTIWSIGVFVFFSLSHSKLVTYVLPIFPTLALLVAERFDQIWEQVPAPRWLLHATAALSVLWILGLAFLKWPLWAIKSEELTVFLEQAGPLYLALAAAVFVTVGVRGMRRTPIIFGGLAAAQVVLLWSTCIVLCALNPFQSTRHLADIVNERAQPQEKLVAYGISYENVLQTLAFYTHRRIAVYADAGELSLGRDHAENAQAWFVPDDQALAALAHLSTGSWIVTDAERWQHLKETSDLYVLIEKQSTLRLLQKVG